MTTKQIRSVFQGSENTPCPRTERLIKAGYQQTRGGYIKYAYDMNVNVDYSKAEPTQWWHIIRSYCDRSEPEKVFGKSIKCGELLFWMAEVLECVDKKCLDDLVDRIIESSMPSPHRDKTKPQVYYARKQWNDEIQKLCFGKIAEKVECV